MFRHTGELFRIIQDSYKTQAVRRGKAYLKKHGLPCNPVGDANSKTGVPSTYRPVGDTCHKACPLLNNGCYAQSGNVNIHQNRAETELAASVNSAIVAMAVGVKVGAPARLHVSGDFWAPNNKLDVQYILTLCSVSETLRTLCGDPTRVMAWTYTHVPKLTFEAYHAILQASGIEVLYSGEAEAGGAVVMPFEDVAPLRKAAKAQGFNYAKCPAQLKDFECKDCGLCWKAQEKKICIVFDPHGSSKRKVAETVRKAGEGI